jgi:serine/threonine-protein kinase ULK/ATG1
MKEVGEYIITDARIAKGAFAFIHKGKHKYTHKPVAIKEITVKNINNLKTYVKRELEIHQTLNHPNIVKLYDIIIHKHENMIYLIMELCELGDLQHFQNKRPFTEKYIQNYMIQLRDALKYLYDNNIVHRDLKPQNILLTDPYTIKITDFGLARNTSSINHNSQSTNLKNITIARNASDQDLFSTFCGSPIYMSPELLNRESYSSKSDLWSVGVILYELITGNPPFLAKNIQTLVQKVNNEQIDISKLYQTYSHISHDCFDLLGKLLNTDKNNRLEWNDYFNHNWFTTNMQLLDENKLIESPLDYNLLNNFTSPFITIPTQPQPNPNTNPTPNESINPVQQLQSQKPTKNPIQQLQSPKLDERPCTPEMNILEPQLTNSKSSLSSKHEKQDNYQKIKSSRDKLNQFTFNLQSSQFNKSQIHSSNHSNHSNHSNKTTTPININPSSNNDINLSDLEQDDLPDAYNQLPSTNTLTTTGTSSKPINIVYNSKQKYSNHNIHRLQNNDSSSNSSSLSNTPNRVPATSASNGKKKFSPASITNAIKFIKETYDYLNSDTKSL